MDAVGWFIVAGCVLVLMALAGSVLKRLPLSSAMLYLGVGWGLARMGFGSVDGLAQAELFERVTEIAVIISLFTTGLKLRAPLRDPQWRLALRLAVPGMLATVALVAVAGVWGLGLPLGAAILLGAILAPTDPVLASEVQVTHPWDRDRVRFGLTGEAGLNDGSAFPLVMLGLGLLGQHELGPKGLRWLAVDVVWATGAGLGVGLLLGSLVSRLVIWLRLRHKEGVGLDDFLALGLIALSYGVALLIHGYGFLAVFAAGLALRRTESRASGARPPADIAALSRQGRDVATDIETAPAYMAQAVLGFNEQLERIAEVAIVVLLGLLLASQRLPWDALWFAPLLFLVIRPLAVAVSLAGAGVARAPRRLTAWFGVRGIGSLYYLFYAISHGLDPRLAPPMMALVCAVVATSIVAHGISVTPLMRRYERREKLATQGRD